MSGGVWTRIQAGRLYIFFLNPLDRVTHCCPGWSGTNGSRDLPVSAETCTTLPSFRYLPPFLLFSLPLSSSRAEDGTQDLMYARQVFHL
jgi:hypothetical protein